MWHGEANEPPPQYYYITIEPNSIKKTKYIQGLECTGHSIGIQLPQGGRIPREFTQRSSKFPEKIIYRVRNAVGISIRICTSKFLGNFHAKHRKFPEPIPSKKHVQNCTCFLLPYKKTRAECTCFFVSKIGEKNKQKKQEKQGGIPLFLEQK